MQIKLMFLSGTSIFVPLDFSQKRASTTFTTGLTIEHGTPLEELLVEPYILVCNTEMCLHVVSCVVMGMFLYSAFSLPLYDKNILVSLLIARTNFIDDGVIAKK